METHGKRTSGELAHCFIAVEAQAQRPVELFLRELQHQFGLGFRAKGCRSLDGSQIGRTSLQTLS